MSIPKYTMGLICILVGTTTATTFVYDYDVDGRLLEVRKGGDAEEYSLTPAHNISDTLALGDANTNGMPDSLEAYLAGHWGEGYDPFICDSDGDGVCDWNEWMLGTDPFSYDSVFASRPLGGSGGGVPDTPIDFTLSWSSIPFRNYAVKFKPDLLSVEWTVLTNSITATPPVNSWTHEQTTNSAGFYRVLQVSNEVATGVTE